MSSGMRVMMGIFLWFPSSKASSKLIHAPCCLIIALLSSEFSILSPDPPLKQWGDEGPRPARVDTPDPKLCPNIASMKTTHLPPQPSIDPLRSLRSERGTPRLRTLSLLFLFLLLFRSSFTFSHFHDFIFLFSIFLSLLSFFFLPLTWFGIVMQHKSSTLFTSSGGGSVEGSGRKGEEGRIPPPKYGRSARG